MRETPATKLELARAMLIVRKLSAATMSVVAANSKGFNENWAAYAAADQEAHDFMERLLSELEAQK